MRMCDEDVFPGRYAMEMNMRNVFALSKTYSMCANSRNSSIEHNRGFGQPPPPHSALPHIAPTLHTHTQPAFARCGNKYKYKPLTSYMLIYMRRKSLCCGRAAERKRTTDLATTNVRYVRNFIWTGFVVFTWWWSNGETNSSLFPHTICVLCVSLEHIYIYRHIHIYMPHPRRTSSGE